MQVPRLALLKFVSWWSRPNVCPISWQVTNARHDGVSYWEPVVKYVSLSFTTPWTMWSPVVNQICAKPSHPVFPYLALQISSRPLVGRQFRGLVPPVTIWLLSTVEVFQSEEAFVSAVCQSELTLFPIFTVNGLAVRAQW